MGAKVVSQFNMCMVYIWVGVYNILFVWNRDFINVVNISGTKRITCEVKFECQISMEIDAYFVDKWVRMFNLNKILKEFKMEQVKKGSLLVKYRWNIKFIFNTKIMVGGYVSIRYELFIGLNI